MTRLALHPRLAHMVLRARELGAGDLACELAALLSERDLLRRRDGPADADLGVRLDLLRGTAQRQDTDRDALRRARSEVRTCREARTRREISTDASAVSPGLVMGLAYPDRIAQGRPGDPGRFLLRNGQGAFLDPQPLAREEYLVAAELEGQARESRIMLASPLTLEEIETHFANDTEQEDVIEWDAALLENLAAWLGPHLGGIRRLDDLGRLDLADILLGRLRWDQRAALDEWAPSHIQVASGSRIPVDYSDAEAPVLAVRLQELFGVTETPRLGRGRVAVTLHLLSPAFRPVQVTRDLAGFWRTTYLDVRRDLRGRYPRHSWPDDPLRAEPTSRAKRRG
jgi:HrpA-like RNA helicase